MPYDTAPKFPSHVKHVQPDALLVFFVLMSSDEPVWPRFDCSVGGTNLQRFSFNMYPDFKGYRDYVVPSQICVC